MRVIKWYDPNFNSIMGLIASEAANANWANHEGMRVIAESKFGVKISKLEGVWHKITVLDEKKYAWMLLRL